MYISAKADHALRALVTLVVEDRPLTAARCAAPVRRLLADEDARRSH